MFGWGFISGNNLTSEFQKKSQNRFFVMADFLIFIEYERRQRYFRSTCAQIPDHPILPFSMPEVLQLFTNEFVSNICVRNICLVVRRYNNNCFAFGKLSILTITHYKKPRHSLHDYLNHHRDGHRGGPG